MSRTKYVVYNEHSLLYRIEGASLLSFGVLAGSVIRGGLDPNKGPTCLPNEDELRPATEADFAAYRVMLPRDFAA